MHKTQLLFLCLLNCSFLFAQFDHEPVLPELSGNELLQNLVIDYKPSTTLSLSRARDTLFRVVWGENDSLHCVYTDYARYMDPNEDPTQTVFNNGAANGINTEHSYPRSKGAGSGNAEADMHHLYPTRVDVNSARASFPFGEIPDQQTTTWYFRDDQMSNIPNSGIDNYSEHINGKFEMRESFAGNVARAAFYFYTMYKQEADSADPDFFNIQVEDLCEWHFQDPVDEQEWNVTHKIGPYQDGKVNPFVLDCSLATRTYCDQISDACALVRVDELNVDDFISISPNPVSDNFNLKIAQSLDVQHLSLYNLKGAVVKDFNPKATQFSTIDLESGFFILKIETQLGVFVIRVVKI